MTHFWHTYCNHSKISHPPLFEQSCCKGCFSLSEVPPPIYAVVHAVMLNKKHWRSSATGGTIKQLKADTMFCISKHRTKKHCRITARCVWGGRTELENTSTPLFEKLLKFITHGLTRGSHLLKYLQPQSVKIEWDCLCVLFKTLDWLKLCYLELHWFLDSILICRKYFYRQRDHSLVDSQTVSQKCL